MTTNQIKDAVASAITASDSYDLAIAKLQSAFAGKTEDVVRITLLPIVADHYGIGTGKSKTGATAGQIAFAAEAKTANPAAYEAARKKLARLVASICCEAATETPAAKAARLYTTALKAAAKLTPAAKRKLVEALAAELGLKVK